MRWVKLCITTASFSVLLNKRTQGGWFQPQRGIRQGSPLVVPLFILAVDALAICTTSLCSWGYLLEFQTTGTPEGIPLLQYADDTTFFIQGSKTAARTLSSMDPRAPRLRLAPSLAWTPGLQDCGSHPLQHGHLLIQGLSSLTSGFPQRRHRGVSDI